MPGSPISAPSQAASTYAVKSSTSAASRGVLIALAAYTVTIRTIKTIWVRRQHLKAGELRYVRTIEGIASDGERDTHVRIGGIARLGVGNRDSVTASS